MEDGHDTLDADRHLAKLNINIMRRDREIAILVGTLRSERLANASSQISYLKAIAYLAGKVMASSSGTDSEVAGILCNCEAVDCQWYLDEYPDVKRAGVDATLHFFIFGIHEGRAPNAYLKKYTVV